MKESSSCPGVVLYFDKLDPFLPKMRDEEVGEFLRAVFAYARTGELRRIKSSLADVAFSVMRPVLDLDMEKYRTRRRKNEEHGKYMAYCRKLRAMGGRPLSEKAYFSLPEEERQELTANRQYPPVEPPLPTDTAGNKNQELKQNQELNQNQNQNQKQKQKQNQEQEQEQNEEKEGARSRQTARAETPPSSDLKGPDLPEPPVYEPPSAEEFEKLRQTAIRKLMAAARTP